MREEELNLEEQGDSATIPVTAQITTPESGSRDKMEVKFWPAVAASVALAEVFFPALAWLVSKVLCVPFNQFLFAGIPAALNVAVVSVPLLLLGILLSVFLSVFVFWPLAMAVTYFVGFSLRYLKINSEQLVVGTFVGGFIGLLASTAVCYLSQYQFQWEVTDVMFCYVVGSATLLGQVGGAWGAWRALYVRKILGGPSVVFPAKLQFSIGQMLLFTIFFAWVLAVCKRFDFFAGKYTTVVSVWFGAQVLAMYLVEVVRGFFERRST